MILELTTRCTLACPGCPRTWFENKFNTSFPKQDLQLDQLAYFLDCESGRSVDLFALNGHHGDPIYYPHLLQLMSTYRDSKSYFISTNGSYQKSQFWHAFSELLTSRDTIYFSIDGLEHNNHLYRKNSDWQSIMEAIDIVRHSTARVVWKSLIFKYNQHELGEMKQRAEDLGLMFVADVTHRFGDVDLVPDSIDTSVEFAKQDLQIEPQCRDREYISADGYYWPCSHMTSFYTLHQTELWRSRQHWHIKDQTLDQARQRLYQWESGIKATPPDQTHISCKMHCKPGQTLPTYTRLHRR